MYFIVPRATTKKKFKICFLKGIKMRHYKYLTQRTKGGTEEPNQQKTGGGGGGRKNTVNGQYNEM